MSESVLREIIVQLIGFAVFFFILKKTAWGPLLSILDERKKKIEHGFADIENAKKKMETLEKDYQARIAKMEESARVKLQEAVFEGKKIAQDLREKAREDSNQILAKAKENIDLEMAKARQELRTKIVDLTVAATERVLKHELNASTQRNLVQEFIDELAGEPKK